MATRKKKTAEPVKENIREIDEQEILRSNYMPYTMSVITDRALPAIDGFKPSQRRVLYTMYNMGLLGSGKARTKCANIAGAGMRLHPHGDSSIYDTAVRLTQNNEALLMPFIDGKGNFGKTYSRDMQAAASRYTEAKLMPICEEIFPEIKEGAVEMVDNYDGSMKEPSLLPCAFPNILASANMGIAVGMACNFPGFNFGELCRAAAEYIKHPLAADILSIMPAPDFSTGGEIIYDRDEMAEIYRTGRGSFAVRGTYEFDSKNNIILIKQIPYTTSIEVIVEKTMELMKAGKLPEISDIRDESDLDGLKIALDVRRDHKDKVKNIMAFLYENTPLQDNFACNFNLLIAGAPKVLGVREILDEWEFEREIEKREVLTHRREEKAERLHLLEGLNKILLDIDKAVKIVRQSANDKAAKEGLMKAFRIDEVQAEFALNIKLRNFNNEYIINQTKDIEALRKDIAAIDKILGSETGIKNLISKELLELDKKYPSKRRAKLVAKEHVEKAAPRKTELGNYTISEEGYISKTKEGTKITEDTEILVFTDNQLCYKLFANEIPAKETYVGSAVKLPAGEKVVGFMPLQKDRFVAVVYDDCRVSLYSLEEYVTLQNRRCIKNAFSGHTGVIGVYCVSANKRILSVKVKDLSVQGKGSRGIIAFKLKKGEELVK